MCDARRARRRYAASFLPHVMELPVDRFLLTRFARLICALGLAGAAASATAASATSASAAAAESDAPASAPGILTLTPAQAQADVALLRRAFEQAHAGLYRYAGKAQIDAAFARLDRAAAVASTDLALYRAVSEFVATVRCDHTKAELSDAMTRFRSAQPTHLPFRFKLFDGRMFVYASDPAQSPLARGSEVLSINGVAVAELLRAMRPAVSIDGDTLASRDTKLAADSDLMGSDFDQFYPGYYGYAGRFHLRVRAPGAAAAQDLDLNALRFRDWTQLPWDGAPQRDEFYKSVTFRLGPKHSAVLEVDTFVNYRNPVDAMAFYDAFFATLAAQQVQTLIIDLRANGGGSNDATLGLAAHLLAKPFTWNKPILQKAVRFGDWTSMVETWGDRTQLFEAPMRNFIARADGWYEHVDAPDMIERMPMAPAPTRFAGKVIVLSSPANASGATMLLAKLRDEGRVTIVGQPTGGSAEGPTAGRLLLLSLPASGIKVRIPLYWNRMNIASFAPGLGIAPDIAVNPLPEDMPSGRDRVMEAAQALL
jgi:hypothetical protein